MHLGTRVKVHARHSCMGMSVLSVQTRLPLCRLGVVKLCGNAVLSRQIHVGHHLCTSLELQAALQRVCMLVASVTRSTRRPVRTCGLAYTRTRACGCLRTWAYACGLVYSELAARAEHNVRGVQADDGCLDFLEYLLTPNPEDRPTALEALRHSWLSVEYPSSPEE